MKSHRLATTILESDATTKRTFMSQVGFTLVELLVVISIISLLIAMLMPALSQARASSQSIYCMNNLKNIGQATTGYIGDNKTYYPPYSASTVALTWGPAYMQLLATYLGGGPTTTDMALTQLRRAVASDMQAAGRLSAQSWVCPRDTYHAGGNPQGTMANCYAMQGAANYVNSNPNRRTFIISSYDGATTASQWPYFSRTDGEITQNCVYMAEGGGGFNNYFVPISVRQYDQQREETFSTFSFDNYHPNNTWNYLMAGMNVKNMRWQDTGPTPAIAGTEVKPYWQVK